MADIQTQDQTNEANKHQTGETNDAAGKLTGDRGDAKAEPSGYRGNNSGTSGSGETRITSPIPEKAVGQLNPSSPGDTGTTPGTNAEVG